MEDQRVMALQKHREVADSPAWAGVAPGTQTSGCGLFMYVAIGHLSEGRARA